MCDFWFQLIEDRLLHCVDFAHGHRATFDLYPTQPGNFRRLCDPWQPPTPLTTSYLVPMEPPVIAGRIFLRTERGTIACYDLRQPK